MYFDSVDDIVKIAAHCGTAIFVVPRHLDVRMPGALNLQPKGKSVISIEQVRELIAKINTRQTTDTYITIKPAENLSPFAANALLKSLEEPGEKIHFVLITSEPSQILPTILSRAAIYFLKTPKNFDGDIAVDEKIKGLAKRLLVAKGTDLLDLAEEITKKKDGARAFALEIIGTSIEMLYKTYYITNKEVFLKKIPSFLRAYDGVARNGHIKLQIVSNLC